MNLDNYYYLLLRYHSSFAIFCHKVLYNNSIHIQNLVLFVSFLPSVTLQLLLDFLDLDTERIQARQFIKCPSVWVCLMFHHDEF